MTQNTYTDLIAPEHVRLIVARASGMGFPPDQIDDLQQTIVPKLTRFRFDPARSNGASETTAVIAVIDLELKAFLRRQKRYERRLERARMNGASATRNGRPVAPQEPIDMQIDVREALAQLSERDQRVCKALSEGQSVSRIARDMGCGWHTVMRIVTAIRERFTQLGLDAWVTA